MSSLRDYMSSVINLDEVPTQEQAREVPPLSTEGYIELLKELQPQVRTDPQQVLIELLRLLLKRAEDSMGDGK